MKRSLSKAISRSLLTYQELEETLLDVETCMNNRPLLYQGEEFEQPVLTPNTLLRGKPTPILEEDLEKIAENGVTRRMRFLQRSKENLRKRFLKEYVHALEEKQRRSTGRVATVSEKSGKNENFSRSGKSQGILQKVRENLSSCQSQ